MVDAIAARTTRREKLRQISERCRIAARRYDSSIAMVVRRLVHVYVRVGIPPREALRMGLADPRLPDEVLDGCISKPALLRLQRQVNPDSLFWQTGDKGIFYSRCAKLGIPVPAVYAVFGRGIGPVGDGDVLSCRADWEHFFLHTLPPLFVVKPVVAGFGDGVQVFSRQSDRFVNGSGAAYSASTLYERLVSDTRHQRFVFQERVFNHAAIVELSGSSFLQTLRLTSFIDSRGQVVVPYGNFKLIAANNSIDNFDHGRTGNLVANVCMEDGSLSHAMTIAGDSVGIVTIPHHPATGLPVEGFRLPFFDAAVDLVKRSARLFQPIRTLGWDIALTPHGPLVVEANHYWDPVAMILVGPQAPGVTRHGMHAMLDHLRGIEPGTSPVSATADGVPAR